MSTYILYDHTHILDEPAYKSCAPHQCQWSKTLLNIELKNRMWLKLMNEGPINIFIGTRRQLLFSDSQWCVLCNIALFFRKKALLSDTFPLHLTCPALSWSKAPRRGLRGRHYSGSHFPLNSTVTSLSCDGNCSLCPRNLGLLRFNEPRSACTAGR